MVSITRIDDDTIPLLDAIAKGILASFMKTITDQGLEKKVWLARFRGRDVVTYTTFTSRYGWNDSEVIVCEKRRLTGFEV